MKPKQPFLVFFLFLCSFCKAQETVVLDTSMFEKNYETIGFNALDGWIFHEGNNVRWAEKNIDTTGWKKFLPNALSIQNADKKGRAEGWFRLQFKLDSSFSNMPLTLLAYKWIAKDIYIDGIHIASTGNTGIKGEAYKESTAWFAQTPVPLSLKPGIPYVIAIHVVDYPAPLNPKLLKSQVDGSLGINLAGPESVYKLIDTYQEVSVYFTLYTSVCAILCLLFWFLYFQNRSEKALFVIACGMSFLFLSMLGTCIYSLVKQMPFLVYNITNYGSGIFLYLFIISGIIILAAIFKKKIKRVFILVLVIMTIYPIFGIYFAVPFTDWAWFFLTIVIYLYLVISSWKKLAGAQWSVIGGILFTIVFLLLMVFQSTKYSGVWPFPFCYVFMGGMYLSFPLSLMVYVAMRFKEILRDVRENARQVIEVTEEKRNLLASQNEMLEKQVEERTKELKASQAQLIQSEKMASLGELTAGIAHEIQNPLNFVNNFSELSNELVDEMNDELNKGDIEEAKLIAGDIKQNLEKINHHGKRADAIVKGMLQHSRSGKGEKEATDINKLVDEYLRLSYQGIRAKDNAFNTEIKTEFDESIGNINLVPQDIGRVLLNLYNNAFYAVNEKQKAESLKPKADGSKYEPTVTVSTKKVDDKIVISVKDNGNGIPEKIKEKIFQPFFTTKPTGSGTGLGLSLSYDIVKAHGGEIQVESKEGEGSEFIILLPA